MSRLSAEQVFDPLGRATSIACAAKGYNVWIQALPTLVSRYAELLGWIHFNNLAQTTTQDTLADMVEPRRAWRCFDS